MSNSAAKANKPIFSSFFTNLPSLDKGEEALDVIAKTDNVVIERIVSDCHASHEWYDQEETEFCAVLRGAANLLFEHDHKCVRMQPGEWVIIPAHVRHKVTWTDDSQHTIWIAVKWKE